MPCGRLLCTLQHNAHFRDKGCRFEPPLMLFLTPLAQRRPRDREPLCLCSCGQMPRNLLPLFPPPPPNNPSFLSPLFAGPKMSQAQNGFPRLMRLVFRRRLPVQHIAWTVLTTKMDPLPTSCNFPQRAIMVTGCFPSTDDRIHRESTRRISIRGTQ
jgi:hypothetical protein